MAKQIQSYDFLIIGGGMAGISVAATLATHGSVAVLETESHIGYHSTGRSAATYIRNYGNSTLRVLNNLAFPFLDGEAIGESVLQPRGELLLVTPQDESGFTEFMETAQSVEALTAHQASEIVPCIRKEKIIAAVYEPDARDIDVDRLLQGYAKQLKKNNGQIHTNTQVLTLDQDGRDWLATTNNGNYRCRSLINAAGAWADQLGMLAGLPAIGIQPLRRSVQVFDTADTSNNIAFNTETRTSNMNDWPLFGNFAETWYAKPQSGRLMISPADEDPVDAQDAWPDDEVLAAGVDRFEKMVDLELGRPTHSWAGLRSFTADRSPVVGEDPLANGFYWLAGQGGYGIQTAPATASTLASLCLDNSIDDQHLVASISPARFDRKLM